MIPDKINICGIPFDVEQRDDLNLYSTSSEVTHGYIEHSKARIKINSNIAEVLKLPALYHEWVHGALVMMGYDELSNDEQFVQSLSVAIYQTFQIKEQDK